MDIAKDSKDDVLTIRLIGRLDTVSAPSLEGVLKHSVGGVKELVFDFKELEYIASAGLRVLLSAQKVMNKQGRMVIRNVGKEVMDVFEVTGFTEILTIEQEGA